MIEVGYWGSKLIWAGLILTFMNIGYSVARIDEEIKVKGVVKVVDSILNLIIWTIIILGW